MSMMNKNSKTGTEAFLELLRGTKVRPASENPNKNKLFVTYTRCNVHGEEVAPEGVIFYYAEIKLYDEFGHPNTATTLFHVNEAAEAQKGEEAVKAELNEIVNQKMRSLVALRRNSL